jgi:hypothetical protein
MRAPLLVAGMIAAHRSQFRETVARIHYRFLFRCGFAVNR